MKPINTALLNFLNSLQGTSGGFQIADCFTFLLANGAAFYLTTYDQDLVIEYPSFPNDTRSGSAKFSSSLSVVPLPDKETGVTIQWGLGTEVDSIQLKLVANPELVFEGGTIMQAFVDGLMDNADVWLERVYMSSPGNTSMGSVPLFKGNISDITEANRLFAQFDIKDRREKLNIPFPYNVFQPACRWTLYSAGCTLIKANWGVNGAVLAGGGALGFNVNLTNPTGYFDQGTILFTSGENEGIEVAVRQYINGSPSTILLFKPLPAAPAAGDQFTGFPGCDYTMATCQNKFGNLTNHGGFEFVPVAETAA